MRSQCGYPIVIEGIPLELTVADWETVTTDNERMTGRFRVSMRAPGLQGSIGVNGEARIVASGAIARSLRRKYDDR